jgi:hypothetical protein
MTVTDAVEILIAILFTLLVIVNVTKYKSGNNPWDEWDN